MFQTLKNAWKIPELKSKILFTIMIVVLYRLGSNLPMPWVNPAVFETYFNASGNALTWLNILSGGALAGKETSHSNCPLCPISRWGPSTWTRGLNPGLPHVN